MVEHSIHGDVIELLINMHEGEANLGVVQDFDFVNFLAVISARAEIGGYRRKVAVVK